MEKYNVKKAIIKLIEEINQYYELSDMIKKLIILVIMKNEIKLMSLKIC